MTLQTLKSQNLILFEAIAGSKAFGLDTPTSDTDIKGVFYLPKDDFFGQNYIPQISNETNDIVYYELGRFVELLQKNNPNILEILASPEDCILYKHPIMQDLKVQDFLSKLCKDTFAGYASSQIKKAKGLNKKIQNPMEKERKSLLDFCFVLKDYGSIPAKEWLNEKKWKQEKCGLVAIPNTKGMYAVFYDESNSIDYKGIMKDIEANQVSLSSIPKGEKQVAYLFCNLDAYTSYCKSYREYWSWVSNRNEERYATNSSHGHNYDSKNMMHTIRLLFSCEHIFKKNAMQIRVANREELLAIKAGKWTYEAAMEKAESLIDSIENFYLKSTLPESPNIEYTTQLLIKMREKLYQ